MFKTVLVFLIFSIVTLLLPFHTFAQSAAQVSASFLPASITAAVNTNFTIDIQLTATPSITAQVFVINTNFDTAKLELISIEYLKGQKSANLGGDGNEIMAAINSRQSPAEIKLVGEILDPNGLSMTAGQPVSFVKLTFKVKTEGQTNINIVNTSNLIVVRPDTSLYALSLSAATLTVNSSGASPSACSAFSPVGLTDSGQVGPGGIKIYNADSKGGRKLLNITRSPATATINQPTFTKSPASASDLTFEQAADGSGNWLVNIPENTSSVTDNDYTFSAVITAGTADSQCTPFITRVAKGGLAACTADITSTQAKLRLSETESWSTTKTISVGDTVKVGGFHNNRTTPTTDTSLIAVGPVGSFSEDVDIINNSFTPRLSGSYTITASTIGKTGANCTGAAVLTVNAATTTTQFYRIAESPSDFTETGPNGWKPYTTIPMPIDFEFKDKNPGDKFVFVEFKDSTGKIERKNTKIKLLGADPVIISCVLSFEGNNTVLNLTGENFATASGAIKSRDTTLQVKEWKVNKIKAVLPNAPEGEILPVSLTNADGQIGIGQCSAISQLAIGAKFFCRAPSSHDMDNVDLSLAGAYKEGTKVKQKVKVDKEGIIQGLTQKLEAGKNYKLSLKAPHSLRKTVAFTAGEGATNISDFVLPIGDIFPVDTGDGVINGFDKSELNRQWIISQTTAGRSGDFNQDGRVNAFDWACMRYDFNKSSDAEPTPGE